MSKTIGILGGMGPLATIDLFQKIVFHTPAQTDQEHIRLIIYNNPKIPPRILAAGEINSSPLPELINSALTLVRAGADFIVMPCHSSHYWFNEVKQAVSIPFYSIVENTVQTITAQQRYDGKKILMLGTDITVNSGLYHQQFAKSSITLVTPKASEQAVITKAIKAVKAGGLQTNQCLPELNRIFKIYQSEGVDILLGCCTEMPLLFPYFDVEAEMLDPTLMLAELAIRIAASNH